MSNSKRELGRPTARETLASYFPEHDDHSPVRWEAEPMKNARRPGDKRVTITCSCGGCMTLLAIGEVHERLKVGFRNVAQANA